MDSTACCEADARKRRSSNTSGCQDGLTFHLPFGVRDIGYGGVSSLRRQAVSNGKLVDDLELDDRMVNKELLDAKRL